MKIQFIGETGTVRINDRPLTKDELVEVLDDEVDDHLALGVFKPGPADAHIKRAPKSAPTKEKE